MPKRPTPPYHKHFFKAARAADRRKAKEIELAIRLTWDSLESHLTGTYAGKQKCFHRQCIEEYAQIIHILSKLY